MPELQEIDRLIAGTPSAEAPEAAAGPSVQEIDRLIASVPSSRSALPKADLTGAMGAGAEGFQVGQVMPEAAAATPKVLPGVPSQAEVMATAPGAQIAPVAAAAEPIQIPSPPPVAVSPPQAPAAPYEGPLPKLPEILTGPTPVGQAVSQALQAGVQSVTEGAKNITEGLTGFLTTTRQTPEETFPGHKIRAARQIMDGLFNLGLAPFLAAGSGARELLREVNPGAESAEIVDPTTSAFVREMLGGGPPERTPETVAALRKPMTIGEVMELALTLGLPTIIHGRIPKRTEGAATEVKPEAIREAAKPTQAPSPPPQIIPEVADVLRRAEEASQRAEAALKQVEALTAKAKAPPPLEVPPEAKPVAPEAKPEVPTAEVPPPPLAGEKPSLPAGRIAEAARPAQPVEIHVPQMKAPQIEAPTPPRRPKTPPPAPAEDEMAALRRELNPEVPISETLRATKPAFTPLEEVIRRAWGEPGGTTAIEAARQGVLPLFLDAYQTLPESLRRMWQDVGGFGPSDLWRTLRGDLSRLTPVQRTFLRRLGVEPTAEVSPQLRPLAQLPQEGGYEQRGTVLQEGQPALLQPMTTETIQQPGSVLPREVTAFMRTAEGRGKAGFDPRIVKVLGQNLYSGPLDMIAVKEMVQNAVDALRPKGGGRIEAGYDVDKRTVWVTDDGPGMSADMATSELLDIGGSKKYEGASGGFGIAKVAIFANADRIVIDTRWRDPKTDKILMTQLSGSAQEWMGDGLSVKTSEAPPGTPTGTDFQVTLKPDARLDHYSTKAWMENFLNNHRLEGYDLNFTMSGAAVNPESSPSVRVGTLRLPGGEVEVYATGGQTRASFARVAVLNNGLYQFATSVYFPDKVEVPERIVLDIKAGSPDAPDYPFRPDREGLKGPAMDSVERFLNDRFVGDYVQRINRRYKEAWAAAAEAPGGLRLIDTTDGAAYAGFVRQVGQAPYLEPLGREFSSAVPAISEAVGRVLGERFKDIEFAGYGTGPTYLAVNIKAEMIGESKNQVLMNPWLSALEVRDLMRDRNLPESEAAGLLAEWMVQSALHEIAHQGHRGHGESFSGFLTRAVGPGRRPFNEAVDRIQSVLEADNHALAKQILEDSSRYDQVARPSGKDLFGPASAGLAAPAERAGGEGNPPPGEAGGPELARPVRAGGENPPPVVESGARSEGGGSRPPERGGPPPGGPRAEPSPEPERPARPDLTERVAQAGKQFPQEDFAPWAESMRGALGPGVEPYLRPAWDKIKGVEATAPGEAPPPAEPPKSPFQAPPRPPEATTTPPEGPPPLQESILTLGRHKEVVDAAGEMFDRAGVARDQNRWPVLSDQILDAMREGTLELPVMREVLQAHGLTLAEFGESMFRPAVRNAAQRLQMLSVLQRRLNRMAVEAGRGTEADALLSLAQQVETLRREGGDEAPLKELSWWRRADNIRRGLLVTQLATAVRNFETQVGRLGIDVLDQATQKVFGGKVVHPWASWEAFADTLSQVRPTKGGLEARKASQAEIESLLQAFPKEWDRLFGSYSSDIARQAKEAGTPLGGVDQVFTQAEKVVNLLNFFNRFQEFAVRRSVFGADLGSRLERRGIDLEALAKGERRLAPEEWDVIAPDVKASVQKALEVTFAQSAPYGSLGWHFTQFVNKAPVILTGPLPFPRFMVNSLKFLYDFSPMPLLKLMTSPERAKIAAGDRQMLSRASIGTSALLGAWLIREAQPDENKWYEMDVPGLGTTDIRPFNPFAAYFFLGDLAKRARTNTLYRTDWRDIVRGVASANVSGGLGLFALDKIIAGLGELAKPGKTMEAVSQAGGEALSGLLVPLRTLTDLYAQFDPEWQVVRERRGEPLLGPAKAQFGVGEPQYLPTRAEPQMREQPALRQATGITKVSEKNDLERELDRFQFGRTEIQGPSTGDPVADNLITKHMGQLAENQTLPKINSLRYQGLSDPQRMEWLKVELSRIRAIARSAAKREDPELFKEAEAGKVPGRRRLLNVERAGQGLAPLRGR